ncbi:MAG: hypothetical protein ACK5KL_00160 [Dysgonomonas sp.]
MLETSIDTALIYSKIGYYVEDSKLLQSIDSRKLDDNLLLIDFYKTYGYYCDHYGLSNDNYQYFEQSSKYRDSLPNILPKSSFDYQVVFAEYKLYGGEIDEAGTLLLNSFFFLFFLLSSEFRLFL